MLAATCQVPVTAHSYMNSPPSQPRAAFATHRWTVRLAAEFGHADITHELQEMVKESGLQNGVLTVQMLGSTVGGRAVGR